MIKLSIKSQQNNNVNLSSKTTSLWDKDGENFFVNYRFSDKGRTRFLAQMPGPKSSQLLCGSKIDFQKISQIMFVLFIKNEVI